ncbi:hypothetical protein HRR83_004854 [Exophiala dermatitidis]|uniref:Alpha-1,6-mannosyltransferase Och1 n=2 Tax=Exophiala dermatitidis TaxID=5970 RepID=H6C3S2_EXODN|nr:alpha-1,6-mannosyltransferase Och1 [Exophiala dermatitidis NIH/UT8656]KAJ4513980.1 hypothetical protein HRR75_004561 [Exophiala dermatitidis]EHY58287.1 alpha-1,6-mannosyltransferase Och1 [Exophiala dermatitidis NIH/UT8656]KAJ4517231.1 hypothetical protein HRR74_004981 [Exophiala dermatitidis]KAJ4519592.1 hypothetical protein HRR73_003652 [Exophiala dermatitidis]KAJ4534612.1 hypothetical protein HRR76_006531 [Exophiala dermatitidis]
MVSGTHLTRYWAATIIVVCVLYWSLHRSSISVLSSHLPKPNNNKPSPANVDKSLPLSRPRVEMDEAEESQHLAEALESTFVPIQQYPSRFPRIVWQTANEHGREKYASKAETWKKVQGFEYNFLNDDQANDFVHENFASRPAIIKFWDGLGVPVLKADFLRYLLMLAAGGVYSDIDTSMLVHPDRWIPIDLGANTVNAIIGIEYDDHTYPMFVRPIGLCQWTLMSKPGHPIFELAVQRVISNLEYIARRKRVELPQLTLDKMEVLEATGPGMITDVVMHVLNEQGQNVTWDTFHDQKEPKLYGDVLILPINGFAGSQKHSHAGDPAYGEKYVQHHFGRSWYNPDNAGTDADKAAAAAEEQKKKEKEKEEQERKEKEKQKEMEKEKQKEKEKTA